MQIAQEHREIDAPSPAIPLFTAGNVLHLILMPTEKCNFRCTYCYEDFVHGRMSQRTIDGICRLVEGRAPGLSSLTIEWFGGEPLLELPIVEEIQTHVKHLVCRYAPLNVRASMTTNGYLLSPEVLSRMIDLEVTSFQISLDGTATGHDARRRRGDGEGTFDRIWENLLAAHSSNLDFRIRLRTHVDRDNHTEIESYLETLARHIGDDERFEIFLRPVARLGGPNDDTIPVLQGSELEIVDVLRRRAEGLGLRLCSPGGPDACYAAAANSFVIRSTGEIAKCTVAFQHPNNRVGQLHPDGTATLDNGKINGWVRGLFSRDAEELRCPMHGFADSRPSAGPLTVLSSSTYPSTAATDT